VKHEPILAGQAMPVAAAGVFSPYARDIFAECYPEVPHKLRHSLRDHPLLALEALAQIAESLPAASCGMTVGDLPIGVVGPPTPNGLGIGETIRGIADNSSRAVLRNVEKHPACRALLTALVGELKKDIEARTGKIASMQAFIYVSSPGAVSPFYCGVEHKILLQLDGSKTFTQFPAGDSRIVPDTVHEAIHTGGPLDLRWRDEFAESGTEWRLVPGDALYIPAMAPHHAKVGSTPSISLVITWRSEWSLAEGEARAFNALLRRMGFNPDAPGRWPARNRFKQLAWRLCRRLTR